MSPLRPTTADELLAAVKDALADATPLEILGRGTKRDIGRPFQAGRRLETAALTGVTLYEPGELVLSARAGTPMAEIEELLKKNRQEFAFEPPDLGPLLGGEANAQTIGGVVAGNLAGPRRLRAGAARDHFLGFHAVSGRGEAFKSGGRVMKNVTGYDLSKLMAGSWGTLAVLSDVTMKVLPAAEKTRSVLVIGLDPDRAVRAMTAAMQSAHDVSGAAHLPASLAARSAVGYVAGAGAGVTALRVEGTPGSVEWRCAELKKQMAGFGAVEELHSMNSAKLWRELRDAAYLVEPQARPVWRLSVPPQRGPAVIHSITRILDVAWFMDWGGGLVWLSVAPGSADAGAGVIRDAVGNDGHATLYRAPADLRAQIPVFHPQPPALAALAERVKDSFDPKRILNPGRMYARV
ncbi:MAG: glycolate oxidase subunit GlcE [Alphaproteobacteria bacterium]|nr:glycolate oxidase subunit GlcE [Alphaproteobacteria bacterium]